MLEPRRLDGCHTDELHGAIRVRSGVFLRDIATTDGWEDASRRSSRSAVPDSYARAPGVVFILEGELSRPGDGLDLVGRASPAQERR